MAPPVTTTSEVPTSDPAESEPEAASAEHKAKPPPIQPITPDEWVSRVQEYQARAEKIHDDEKRKPHLELARWAHESGLEDEAWEQWIVALDLGGPKDEVWKQMGFGLGKDGPYFLDGPKDVNPRWVEKVRKAGRGYSFRIAIQDDAPKAFFDDLGWRVRRMNWFFWRVTEGQVFLDEIEIIDKEEDGRFVIAAGKLDATLLTGGGAFCANPGTPDWKVISAGGVYVRILAHEMLHGIFGLPDERHGCACIMQGGLYGIRSDQLSMCDSDTHRHDDYTPTACWDLARERFPDMAHPNSADFGAPPDVKLKIVDR
jgi:hypothetical protein